MERRERVRWRETRCSSPPGLQAWEERRLDLAVFTFVDALPGGAVAVGYERVGPQGGGDEAAGLARIGYAGILQADTYAGYNRLYEPARSPGPVTEAACFAHARRKFYELADIAAGKRCGKRAPPISPLAMEP